jgi:hypothetical protein
MKPCVALTRPKLQRGAAWRPALLNGWLNLVASTTQIDQLQFWINRRFDNPCARLDQLDTAPGLQRNGSQVQR